MKHIACSNMWEHLQLNVLENEIVYCCKMKRVPVSVLDLKELGSEIHKHPLLFKSKQEILEKNDLPNACEKCKRHWPNSMWHVWNKWKDKDWTSDELENLKDEDLLRNIEVYLSNTCTMSCLYCDPGFSSTWADLLKIEKKDNSLIKQEMLSCLYKYLEKYQSTGIKRDRLSISFLGGEPFLNLEIFDVIKNITSIFSNPSINKSKLWFVFTSNLMVKEKTIDNFIDFVNEHSEFTWVMYVSIDSSNKKAELIREGLDLTVFEKNLRKLSYCTAIKKIVFQPAVNLLSIIGYDNTLKWFNDIAIETGRFNFETDWDISCNEVINPWQMNCNLLPESYKIEIDKCFSIIDAYYPDNISTRNLKNFLLHIKTKIGTVTLSNEQKNKIINFYKYQGELRNKDYFQLFPELRDITK